jgi:uncharacterized protein YggE
MKTLKSLTILLLIAATVSGQEYIVKENEKPYIEVTGIAEKKIVPDEIYISITIRERHEGKNKITIEKQETDLKEALKSIGVPLDNLSLSDKNANYIRVKWSKKDVITKAEYILIVEDALTVGKVFEKLDELKIVDAVISKVSHSKIREFKKEVRILAIKAAKEKADYLLVAIGEKTGKALIVRENTPAYLQDKISVNVMGVSGNNSGYLFEEKQEEEAIEFQKIKLQAMIYVKFEIE